jgi:hypothetical protein
MSRTISLFLILALGFQCLSKLSLIAYYNINIEYIIQELCENKDKPQLNCKGKCYLKKKLNEANKSEEQAAGSLKRLELPVFICNSFDFKIIQYSDITILPNYLKDLYSLSLSELIFHPPCVKA